MFQVTEFEKVLRTDNPHYERIRHSELHDVVNLVSRGNTFRVEQLVSVMSKVSPERWKKYSKTRSYLIRECPRLLELLAPKIIEFHTLNMRKGAGGHIIHDLIWTSSTGVLEDLRHKNVRVREKVYWKAPDDSVQPYVIEDYRRQGKHYGVGNAVETQGWVGRSSDSHDAVRLFSPDVLKLRDSDEVEFVMYQTYQQTNGASQNWTDIPLCSYRILRRAKCIGEKIQFTIKKENIILPNDRLSNMVEISK
ncbi:hypothetical protein [Xenorhabdus griffiniae]|uniref:hypothetical protein n=1 Tax=Xenorhabdus griffiniae TaxID=351672 RepID=UPI002359167A|nr:hypothetical protein [Xenorhabdus griffiniae]MDC9605396.1 hypothetical protein [Xenorhabdus griffiniae]